METAENKYINVQYKLYTIEDGEKKLVEETQPEHPFNFISGLGTTLEEFEAQVANLKAGDKFSFTIPADKAYGEYDDAHVHSLPRNMFEVEGKFDEENIAVGKIVPLMSQDGRRFNGVVTNVTPETVEVDLNHPLAGDDLLFEGEVTENRPATTEEVNEIIKMMSGGCGCGEGGCGDGDCGDGCCDSEGGCGCH